MPKLRPPPNAAVAYAEPEDNSLPTEDVEIQLGDDVDGDVVVELEPQTAPPKPPKPPAPPADAADDDPLKKAVEATRRAEELQRQAQTERDAALRQARDREDELTRERGDREDAQYNSVLTAIAAEQSALEKAKQDWASAAAQGDWNTAATAQSVMAGAAARIDRLEDGKQAFDSKREAAKTAPPVQRTPPPTPGFEQRIAELPEPARNWLRQHPEFINDPAKNRKIGTTHGYLVETKSIEPFSQAYFDALDTEFGFKQAPEPEPQRQTQPQRRSIPVSAPVSRDIPSASGQRQSNKSVILDAEERRIARTSFTPPPGVTLTNEQKELMYARNKQKLDHLRATGQYPTRAQESR